MTQNKHRSSTEVSHNIYTSGYPKETELFFFFFYKKDYILFKVLLIGANTFLQSFIKHFPY